MESFLKLGEKGRNQWWRYLIVLILVIAFFGPIGYIPTELYLDSGDFTGYSSSEIEEIQINSDFEAVRQDKNIGFLTLLSPFLFGLIMLFVGYKFIHRKTIMHLVNSMKKIRWRHVLFGFTVWGSLLLLSIGLPIAWDPSSYDFTFKWNSFLPLLAICLIGLPIQVAFEELFVRSYMMQGVYNLFKTPIVPIVVSSLVFAVLHMSNPEVSAYGWLLMFFYYFGNGIMLAIVTIWDEGIELAFGIHFANNFLLALCLSYADAAIQIDSMWRAKTYEVTILSVGLSYVFFGITLYAVYRFIERRKRISVEV